MDVLVGAGTGALAVFTAVLAYATWRMAHAGEWQSAITLVQVERAHRPVLVPLQRSSEQLNFRGGQIDIGLGPHITENPPDRQDLPAFSAALLAVENVGMGPALNVQGTFEGPRGSAPVRFPTEGVAAGSRAVVAFETATGESVGYTGNDSSVSAVLEYSDVAGKTYRTHVTYEVGSSAYRVTLQSESELESQPGSAQHERDRRFWVRRRRSGTGTGARTVRDRP